MNTIDKSGKSIIPTHKVGVKVFTDSQLANVFPNYNNLLNRIENHRFSIKGLEVCKTGHYQYNLMYDNVFSIFGKRGTGKTSVVFTLRQKIENDDKHPYDVVLPIIIPEVIPADCSALGWLLAIIKDHVLELEQELKSLKLSSGYDSSTFWSNCKYTEESTGDQKLSKAVDHLVELNFAGKYNPANETTYKLAVGNSAKQAQNYYKFSQTIAKFWDEWVDAIRSLYILKNGMPENKKMEITPLIYFIFDDVDLAPEKVSELMSIIIKYLSHPNIIVITTADEEMFLEVIENNLDNNIGRLPKEWRAYLKDVSQKDYDGAYRILENRDISDVISETARLYLGKVMPTSTRYYLNMFESSEEKQWFYLIDGEQLGEGIAKQVDCLLGYQNYQKGYKKNFLRMNGNVITFYLNFFGETSRQIGNTYLSVQEFIEGIIASIQHAEDGLEEDIYFQEIFDACRHFLHVAINSNHNITEVIENIELFIKEVFWLEHNGWRMYINYASLQELIHRFAKRCSREAVARCTLQLYSLFLFLENILLILEKCTRYGISNRQRVHGILGLIQLIQEYVFDGKNKLRRDLDADGFFLHYKTLLERLSYIKKERAYSKKDNIDYFYDFLSYEYKEINSAVLVKAFNNSREWLREIAGELSMVYGNLYLVEKKEIDTCLIYKNEKVLCEYQKMIQKMLLIQLRECLNEFNLIEKARAEIQRMKSCFKNNIIVQGDFSMVVYDHIQRDIYDELRTRIFQESGRTEEDEKMMDDMIQKYHSERSGVSMSTVINTIEDICQEESLEEVIAKLPEHMVEIVKKRLASTEDADGMFVLLKILFEFIDKSDYMVQDAFLVDVSAFVDAAYELGEMDGISDEIEDMADYISKYFSLDERNQTIYWHVPVSGFYRRMKTILRSIHEIELEKPYAEERKKELLEILESNIGVMINMEEKEDFQNAVILGIVVHMAKRIQNLYLYQSIVRKYANESSMSSQGLELMEEHKSKKTSKKRADRYSYYYEMFLKMEQISKDYDTDETEELMVLKSFIQNSASERRNLYITDLINEVNHEANSN